MIKFLFQKNLWTLDLITSLCVGLFLGYLTMSDSDTGNKYSKTNWEAIFFGVSGYVVVFILAVNLRKKFSWIRSWAWLGIVGVLIQVVFFLLIHLPKAWEYKQRVSPTISEARVGILYYLFSSTIMGWLAWGIVSLTFIFTIRFFAYIVLTVYNLYKQRIAVLSKEQ